VLVAPYTVAVVVVPSTIVMALAASSLVALVVGKLVAAPGALAAGLVAFDCMVVEH